MHFALTTTPNHLNKIYKRLNRHNVGYHKPLEHNKNNRSIYVKNPKNNVIEI